LNRRGSALNRKVAAIAGCMTVALGVGPAQAAPAATGAVRVPCAASALAAGIADARAGETLSLAPHCTYVLTAGLPAISQELTILGNRATIERSYRPGIRDFSILTVSPGADLAIGNLNFRHGGSAGSGPPPADTSAGGAIDNNGNLTVNGGDFTGNSASDGGAIQNGSGSLSVRNAVFDGNRAVNGGAVENNGTMVLSHSTVTGNTASSLGGGVATAGGATVADCSIAGNTAFEGGGMWTTVTAAVTGGEFRGNKAAAGGGIFNDNLMTLAGSRVVGNTAAFSGGGVYNDLFGDVTVTSSSFRQNHAQTGGGIENEDFATLSRSQLYGNTAGQFGGGIYNDWVLTVAGSQIVRNIAATGGGGIYLGDSFGPPGTLALSGSAVFANRPDNCEGCELDRGLLRLRPRVRPAADRHWPGGRRMTGFVATAPGRPGDRH
jgi:hypothetical protein